MSLVSETESYLTNVIKSLGYEIDEVKLEKSKMKEYGQYQINVAMPLAKQKSKSPREVAEEITSALDGRFTNVNIQGPGFINLSFSDEKLVEYSNKCLDNFEEYIDKNQNKRKIILDYGGANVAKTLHVGHLRCNIGEAMRRLLNLFGDETISDVHWGDWGTPLGLVIKQIEEEQPNLVYFNKDYEGKYPSNSPVTNEDLGRIYPFASSRKKEDEAFAIEAKKMTERLQKREKGIYDLWKQIVKVSEEDCKKVYDYLNCHFDLLYGESDADLYVPDVLEFLKSKNVLEKSDGALIMNVKTENDNKEIPPLMLVKSDGAILYDTTELATILQRVKDYDPDEIWYFTDERQSLHFEQTFRGAYKSGLVKDTCSLKFFGFGTINGPDGKPFKTREGGVMTLKGLIKLVYDNIEPKIKETITGEERKEVADKLTVATLKYSDLLPYRKTDYIFDVEKFTSFEGKTGIYAVYTTTRLKSLLSKVSTESVKINEIPNDDVKEILVKLTELSKILTSAYKDVSLNYICEFIYDLSSLYNKFYANNNIVNCENEDDKNTFIAISKLTYNVLSKLLNVLGIETVERM